MEGTTKRVIAAYCLLAVILVSVQQQQVAAMSKFCQCYTSCYADCSKDLGPYSCNVECLLYCINAMATPAGDAEACVYDCTNKLGAFAPANATKTN